MLTEAAATRANLTARFLPQDPADDNTLPCVEIAGIQVYVYFDPDDGLLTISAHYDTADDAALDLAQCVPTRVVIGDTDVWPSERRTDGE